jgi:hypothetical protein
VSAAVAYFVFTFDRVSGRLTTSRPVGYESISEAEKAAKVNASEHAGALALTLTVDQQTGSLLDAKVLCAFGEFDMAPLFTLGARSDARHSRSRLSGLLSEAGHPPRNGQ